jgi:hypothetical protein
MKILNANVDIGDMLLVEEKYDPNMHYLKHNRIHIGFVSFLDSSGNFTLTKKKLISPKQKIIKSWKDFFKLFYNTGIANFGSMSETMLNTSQLKSIKVLK